MVVLTHFQVVFEDILYMQV